jgi:dTDP-4-amino-4,6-dideoxygalactose transaminase
MEDRILLFSPHVTEAAITAVTDTLRSRWIGEGPKVAAFEEKFGGRFAPGYSAVGVGAGTDAVHLAYLLAGIDEGDEVITTIFTCTATNTPLLYQRAKIVFADVQEDTLNIDPDHVRRLVNERTKAIVCMPYGGLPCDMQELREIASENEIPLITDAAHAFGATYKDQALALLSDFTAYSFMAIKHITTADGGMLVLRERELTDKARRMRWFGIDRGAKLGGGWDNNIREVGYKYQMTDIAAAMGLAALEDFDQTLRLRQSFLHAYEERLRDVAGVDVVGSGYTDREHAAWLCTVYVDDRPGLERKLKEHNIDSNQVHYRNDRHDVFGGRRPDLPTMDRVEERYLVLPLHTQMGLGDVERVCDVLASGW